MSFSDPWLLLLLLVPPLAATGWWLLQRRRARYAVQFTNVDLLATLVPPRSWRRHVPAALFVLALTALCVAVARPHVTRPVPSERAAVILVLDVSGSMQAQDVKPTRLAAAQRAMKAFLAKVPRHLRVALVLFSGEAQVAMPPTDDHALVAQAVDDAGMMEGYGGTAIGDALATAVRLGQEIKGRDQSVAESKRGLASSGSAPRSSGSSLVSILFLSDGHQTRGVLQPLQGAALAKQAGFPVYTVSLGTTGNTTLRGGFPGGGGGGFFGGGGLGYRGLAPDPATLRAIARTTGGEFFRAKTAGAVEAAYSKLGSSLGREPGKVEITDEFLGAAAVLLVVAGILSALWAPRLP